MLIRITNNCDMGCEHCMIDATPQGAHMAKEVLQRALAFSMSYDPQVLLISGGEPTRHPHFLELVEILKRIAPRATCIMSNGAFDEYENGIFEALVRSELRVQITNDPRYYPRRVRSRVKREPRFAFENQLRSMVPLGRAAQNGMAGTRKSPMCFNLRSAVKVTQDLGRAIHVIRSKGYFCTPSINVDGTVTAGETPFCQKIGTVDDEGGKIIRNLLWMTCNRCKTWDKLDPKIREMFI